MTATLGWLGEYEHVTLDSDTVERAAHPTSWVTRRRTLQISTLPTDYMHRMQLVTTWYEADGLRARTGAWLRLRATYPDGDWYGVCGGRERAGTIRVASIRDGWSLHTVLTVLGERVTAPRSIIAESGFPAAALRRRGRWEPYAAPISVGAVVWEGAAWRKEAAQ